MQSAETEPLISTSGRRTSILRQLYISHSLSTWNSRTFEFGAVLFLAKNFPGTLLYASCYALFRAGAGAVLSGQIGGWVDRSDRLKSVRASIVLQRIPVAISCLVFLFLKKTENLERTPWLLVGFSMATALACIEKLAIITNTVAIERDWVVVIAEDSGVARDYLNATMRRIDLIAKLIAPVFISLVDDFSTTAAIWTVFCQNALSVMIEYVAVAQVYNQIPALQRPQDTQDCASSSLDQRPAADTTASPSFFANTLAPWRSYVTNPAFLASLSLSLLYFTVLSTGVQMQTFLFTLGFTSLSVALMRLAAVVVELLATWAAPVLMHHIGPVRSGLWFINQQLTCVLLSVALFLGAPPGTKAAGWSLIAGVTLSRLGLWGFDLSVQYLVQEDVPADSRGRFSAAEMALQNVAELMSFAMTSVWSRPEEFKYPVYVSAGVVALAAVCFAAFVRKRRGHLVHVDQCIKREKCSRVSLESRVSSEEIS